MALSKTERLSHYGILIIAISALVVSVWQVRILQQHNKLTVKPYLDFTIVYSSEKIMKVTLSNQGFGPAIFEKLTYKYQGKEYSSWEEVLKEANQWENVKGWFNYGPNTIMAPGSELTLLRLAKEDFKQIGIQLDIVYQSIYEENFIRTIEL
ncbi:hypothetical protein QQ008_00385 [Fulvivirgaceae bacterium BMA10]|uniref:Uncharacterized protein n=1 Tax=Splendidivirga corallicola TaxID=3051826 RepID=A0ABT8KJL9_9BACT|nr:hypothetical protein [Fulvivirgaceae bacterium BMA10]